MRLPDAPAISRSVTSGGALGGASGIEYFKVAVRNLPKKIELVQVVSPGSTVTIDSLAPGFWDVAVFGMSNGSQDPVFYGNARNISVVAGLTSYATVAMNRVGQPMVNATLAAATETLAGTGRENVKNVYITYKCDEFTQSGSAFYEYSDADAGTEQPSDKNNLVIPMPDFLEPGYTYSVKAFLFASNASALWSGKISGKAASDGSLSLSLDYINFESELTADNVQGNQPDWLKLEQDIVEQMESYYSFNINFDTKPYSQLNVFKVAQDVCGKIPVIVECGSVAWAKVFTLKHSSEAAIPSSSLSWPIGETKTLSLPGSPKEWPLFNNGAGGTPSYNKGFAKYALYGDTDKDSWSAATFTPQTGANAYYDGTPPNIKMKAEGPAVFNWTMTVTKSADYGYFTEDEPLAPGPSATKDFTGTLTVTGVAAAEPSGGGGGSGGVVYPPDPNWFSFQSSVAVQPEETLGAADEIWKVCTYGSEGTKFPAGTPRYVLFGNYPRSHKASGVTIDTSESHTMGNFTYYKGSDGEWYAKFIVKNNGSEKYSDANDPGQLGDSVETTNSVAYFKLEPIRWRVLTTNYKGTGKALLVTDEALPGYFDYNPTDNKAFSYSNHIDTTHVYGGQTLYCSNYKYSNARAWLNGLDGSGYGMQDWTDTGFINSAFTEAGRMKIAETVVDNSAKQCYEAFAAAGTAYDAYLCENTTDKVFLLSLSEITNPFYGYYDGPNQYNSRVFLPTDLTMASNCYRSGNGGYYYGATTLLRSPAGSSTMYSANYIGYAGNSQSAYYDYHDFFAPAICVDLSATGIGIVGERNVAADSHGALKGKFTVNSSGKQVKFSQSNLWKNYTSTESHFVPQQWYYCDYGMENRNSSKYKTDLLDYVNDTAASSNNIVESDVNTWRLLSSAEWQYLFDGRTDAENKFGVAKICFCDGPKTAFLTGFILLPDNWTIPAGLTFTSGWSGNFERNKYNYWQWKKMEEAGAVFLPAGGACRDYYADGRYERVEWSRQYVGLYWDSENSFTRLERTKITYSDTPSYTEPTAASVRYVMDAN